MVKTRNLPELELREAANERAELIGSTGREARTVRKVLDLRVDLRREKPDEQVEKVDPQAVRHDVEALDQVNAEDVDQGDAERTQPAVEHVRRRFVEQVLVASRDAVGPCRDGVERRSARGILRRGGGETNARRSCVHGGPT